MPGWPPNAFRPDDCDFRLEGVSVESYEEFARSWAKVGGYALPKHPGRKSPNVTGWQAFRNLAPPAAFDTGTWPGICVPMGGISLLEGIEFDADEKDKVKVPGSAGPEFTRYCQALSAADPRLYKSVVIGGYVELSPSGGVHLYIRHPGGLVPGNEKWARWASGKTKIETRGDGGQFVTAPTPGYVALAGMPHLIPVVSAADRELLKNLATAQSERIIRAQPKPDHEPEGNAYVSPRGWPGVFEGTGWEEVAAQGSNVAAGFTRAWARPGHVASEESGAYSAVSSDAVLMVFSSTAHGELEDRGQNGREKSNGARTYTMAEVYAAYNSGGSLYGDDQEVVARYTTGRVSAQAGPRAVTSLTGFSQVPPAPSGGRLPREFLKISKKKDMSRIVRGDFS